MLRNLLLAAAISAVPTVALAGRFDTDRDSGRREYRRDDDRRDSRSDYRGDSRNDYRRDDRRDNDDRRPSGHVDIHIGGGSYERVPPRVIEERVWVAPVYQTVCERQWVPAVYRTVVDRVWVEPVVQNTCERVWVPDRFEGREVVRYENGRPVSCIEKVLVEAGHFAEVRRDVVIAPGHYEDRPRQELVCDAHWQNVDRQVLVSAGHYETRCVTVAEPPRYASSSSVNVRLPFPPPLLPPLPPFRR